MRLARRHFDSTYLEIFAMTSDKIKLYQSSGSPIAEFHYAERAWLRKERGIRRIENGRANHL